MGQAIFQQVRTAISHLNPEDVRTIARQSVIIGLHATSAAGYEEMERFLCPEHLSRERRMQTFQNIFRAGEQGAPERCDIHIYGEGMPVPRHAYEFLSHDPQRTVHEILAEKESLAIPLARNFPPFRTPVIDKTIHTVSKENAFFSLATALPDMIPFVQLPWAIGEFASDTAFLTMNQVRMAFLVAAASDRNIGYKEQRGEIGSILAGAFGWRAIARELAGKIPFGGGLVPKAAIAYAGTFVAGRVLERIYREGYELSKSERRLAYEGAFEKGRRVAGAFLELLRPKRATA